MCILCGDNVKSKIYDLLSKHEEHVEIKLTSRIEGTCVPQALQRSFFFSICVVRGS